MSSPRTLGYGCQAPNDRFKHEYDNDVTRYFFWVLFSRTNGFIHKMIAKCLTLSSHASLTVNHQKGFDENVIETSNTSRVIFNFFSLPFLPTNLPHPTPPPPIQPIITSLSRFLHTTLTIRSSCSSSSSPAKDQTDVPKQSRKSLQISSSYSHLPFLPSLPSSFP